MDATLRLAERAYQSDPTPETREGLLTAARRAGKPLCHECESSDADRLDDAGEPVCSLCRESALEHGHVQGVHRDWHGGEPCQENGCDLCAECSRCMAERGATNYAACTGCGHEQAVFGDWLTSGLVLAECADRRSAYDDVCDDCGEETLVVL